MRRTPPGIVQDSPNRLSRLGPMDTEYGARSKDISFDCQWKWTPKRDHVARMGRLKCWRGMNALRISFAILTSKSVHEVHDTSSPIAMLDMKKNRKPIATP